MGKPKKKCFILILVILVVEAARYTKQTNTPLKQAHLVLLPAQVGIIRLETRVSSRFFREL